MTFKSEIRQSQLNALSEKVADRNYGQYLVKLVLQRVRGFEDQPVSFDFPVTALIGPNGGGKTTILGAAAVAYKSIKPRRFFAKSGKFDDSMKNWSIEHELIDRGISRADTFKRTASFKNLRWDRDALDRSVLVFGIARTVPATERVELQKAASNTFAARDTDIIALSRPVAAAVEKILGKDVSGFSSIKIDTKGRVSLLAGQTSDGVRYSEFHFGAGESSIIRMVAEIESSPDFSLILVEEIENGLHPVATAKVVEYLIDVADRKKAQAIFTTHSNDALRPLPSQAIWAAVGRRVFRGKLDVHALRAITGHVDAELAVFVEDDFARDWVMAACRSRAIPMDLLEVHGMAGDGIAVAVNKHHNIDPSRRGPSLCFIDGDSKQVESESDRVYRLPGQSPEAHVFDTVMEVLPAYAGKLAVALHGRFEDGPRLTETLAAIRRTNRDPHVLFSQVGEAVGLVPESVVRSAFVSIWSQAYADAAEAIATRIRTVVGAKAALPVGARISGS
jgi:energy-coupling factor transporter ATP-binding protein EcfA2